MNSCYNEYSPATSIGQGVFGSASWGRYRSESGDEPVADGQRHRFRAAGHAQLGEDVADVRFDSGRADDQLLGDLGVVQTFDHQRQSSALALRQVVDLAPAAGLRCGPTPGRPLAMRWLNRRAPRSAEPPWLKPLPVEFGDKLICPACHLPRLHTGQYPGHRCRVLDYF